MAKDEKGLKPIAEILSAIIKPEHKPFTPIQEHRETGKPPLRTSQRRPQGHLIGYRLHVALLHDSTAARVGALFQLLVQDTTAQDFGLPSSAIRLRM